jgi:hypothetical protein
MILVQHAISSEPAVGNHEATYFAPSWQSYRATLLVTLALTSYLYIPLTSGGRLLVPSFPTVALIPLLFLTVLRNISKTDELFLPKIAFVLILSIAFSPGYIYVTEKFLSFAQIFLALAVTAMTVRLMQQLRREVLERALLVLWCLLVVGSVLEVAGLIRELSDAFREWAFGGMYTLYDGDARDINFVGWARPKLFATEPSAVSKMFIVSINSWLLIRVTQKKAAVVSGATAVMFLIMGSPMFVVSAAITLAILIWDQRASIRTKVATVLAALIVSVLFLAFFGGSVLSTVSERLDRIGTTTSSGEIEHRSENVRAVIPWINLVNTWSRWPLFGAGIGGKEVVVEYSPFRDHGSLNAAIGSNAAAEVGIYLGLLGGAWFVWLLLMQASQTGVRRLGLMLVLVFLFSMLMGGIESFRYWGHIALLWGALAVADASGNGGANPPRSKGSSRNAIGVSANRSTRPSTWH